MMKNRVPFLLVAVLAVVALVSVAVAQQSDLRDQIPAEVLEQEGKLFHLLDRGNSGPVFQPGSPGDAAGQRTHVSPMNTLFHPGAGTSIGMVSIGFFPTMAPASFIGNFYTAPGDFPTSYYPFFVTGAFAWGTGPPPTGNVVAAGVAPGPFPVGTMMWAAFVTAPFPGPPAMTSGFFGAPGIFPHSPPTVAVPTGFGVACGLRSTPGPGPGVGALAFPATPRPFRVSFAGPPLGTMDILTTATFVLPNAVVAGCYISGATVPVELQSFSIE